MNRELAYQMAAGDQDAFKKHLEGEGRWESYSRLKALDPNPELFEREYQQAIAEENLISDFDPNRYYGDTLKHHIFHHEIKSEDNFTHDSYDSALKGWGQGRLLFEEKKSQVAEMATQSFFGQDQDLTSFLDGVDDEEDREELSVRYLGYRNAFEANYSDVLPKAQKIFSDIQADEQDGKGKKSKSEWVQSVLEMNEDDRNRLAEVIGQMSRYQGEEMNAGFGEKTGKSALRGFEQYLFDLSEKEGLSNKEAEKILRLASENKPILYEEAGGRGNVYDLNDYRVMGSKAFFHEAGTSRYEDLVEKARRSKAIKEFTQTLFDAARDGVEIKGSDSILGKLSQGVYDVAESSPYMTAAFLPFGTGIIANSKAYVESNVRDIQAEAKAQGQEIDILDAYEVSEAIAPIQSTLGVVLDKFSFGRLGFIKEAQKKMAGKAIAAKFVGRAALNIGLEQVEEQVQEALKPIAVSAHKGFSKEFKDEYWQSYTNGMWELSERTFWASLPFAIIGAGVKTANETKSNEALGLIESDQVDLILTPEERADYKKRSEGLGSTEKVELFNEIVQSKSPEERQAYTNDQIQALNDKLQKDFEQEEDFLSEVKAQHPVIERNANGMLEVVSPNGARQQFNSEAEADIAARKIDAEINGDSNAGMKVIDNTQNLGIGNFGQPAWNLMKVKAVKKIVDFLGGENFFKKWLKAQSTFTNEQFAMKLASEGVTNEQLKKAQFTLSKMEKAVKAEAKAINESNPDSLTRRKLGELEDGLMRQIQKAMTGEEDLFNSLPKSLVPITREAREHVDSLSNKLIDVGFAKDSLAETFRQNMGSYLNRSYRRFVKPLEWKDEVTPEMRKIAKDWLRDNIPNSIEGDLDGMVEELIVDPVQASGGNPIDVILGNKNLQNTIQKKDVPWEIRQLWGEYMRADENYMNSVRKMAMQVGQHTFLENLKQAELGGMISEKPKVDYRPITSKDSPSLAPLDGMYVHEDLAFALEEFGSSSYKSGLLEPWTKWWLRLNSVSKLTKTVWNGVTHVRNFSSGYIYNMANGNFSQYFKKGKINFGDLLKRIPKDDNKQKYLERLVRLGVIEQGANIGDVKALLNDFAFGEIDLEEYQANSLKKAVGKVTSRVEDLYSAEDDFHKVWAFESERSKLAKAKKSMTDEELDLEAAKVVRMTTPDYSQVNKLIKALRKFPLVGSFVSFTSEVFRNNANILSRSFYEMKDPDLKRIGQQRLASFMTAHASTFALYHAAKAMFGVSDEEDEAIRALAAPWDKDGLLIYIGRTKSGDPMYINFSYTDPFSLFKTPFIKWQNSENKLQAASIGLIQMFEPFYNKEIFTKVANEASLGRTEDGRTIFLDIDSPQEKLIKGIEHLWNGAFEPGILKSADRIGLALTNRKSDSGVQYDLFTELGALLTGQRVTTVDSAKSIKYKKYEFSDSIRKSSSEFTRELKNENATKKSIQKSYRKLIKDRKKIYENWQDAISAANTLGLNEDEIISAAIGIDGNSMSKTAIEIKSLLVNDLDDSKLHHYKISTQVINNDRINNIKGRIKLIEEAIPEAFED